MAGFKLSMINQYVIIFRGGVKGKVLILFKIEVFLQIWTYPSACGFSTDRLMKIGFFIRGLPIASNCLTIRNPL